MANNSYQDNYQPQITNYLSRDFTTLKNSLIQYSVSIFVKSPVNPAILFESLFLIFSTIIL